MWIGTRSYIAQGLTIGHCSVIAAHAVVTKDVPPYSIVGGVPAKVNRPRFDAPVVERLTTLAWWDWSMDRAVIGKLDFANIEATLVQLESLKSKGALKAAYFKTKRRSGRWYQRLFS